MENSASPFKEDYSRSPRGSVSYDTLRSRASQGPADIVNQKTGYAASMITRKASRASLLPDQPQQQISKSPRNSLIPEDVYNRNPRGSIDPSQLSRGSRSSLLPEVESFSRSARPSLIADVSTLRSSSNAAVGGGSDIGRSNSLYPDRSN